MSIPYIKLCCVSYVTDCGVHRYAHKTSIRFFVHLPLVGPSRFFSSFRITLFAYLTYPFVWGCSTELAVCDVEALVESQQASINALLSIIHENHMHNVELSYNIFLGKSFNLDSRDGCKWFRLYPLGKVIYDDQQKFALTFTQWKRSNNAHSPKWKRAMVKSHSRFVRLGMYLIVVVLTFFAFFDIFDTFRLDVRPIIANSQHSSNHC